MGHWKHTVCMNMCLNLNGYRDRARLIYIYKDIVNGNIAKITYSLFYFNVMFKWQICYS